jgi:hypothetical protein
MTSTFKTAKEIIETSSVVFVVEILATSSQIVFPCKKGSERNVFRQWVSSEHGGVDEKKHWIRSKTQRRHVLEALTI